MTGKRPVAVPTRRYREYFWQDYARRWTSGRLDAGLERDLRALRDGLGDEPGEAPAMRFLHRVELTDDVRVSGVLPDSYRAEHVALVLFGLHQHGAAAPVHRDGVGLGAACRLLSVDALSEKAAQRRLFAAATAQDLGELLWHLRGLAPMLRKEGIGLDYTRLYDDLRVWPGPRRDRVVRAWGLQYTDPSADRPGRDTRAGTGGDGAGNRGGQDQNPYWTDFAPQEASAGAELAALRSGLGKEAGTVPGIWVFYRTRMGGELRARGALTRTLAAEHAALSLFALHQQSRSVTMHVPGQSPGTACARLLAKDGAADREAVGRRLGALLTSTDSGELAQHLRGLVPLLRRAGLGLDYGMVFDGLGRWDDPKQPQAQSELRTRWDRDFHVGSGHEGK